MKKNFEDSSITDKKISPIGCSRVEIFKFLIAQLFMGHPVLLWLISFFYENIMQNQENRVKNDLVSP
jgi:hypothetical protein